MNQTQPATLLMDNLRVTLQLLDAAHRHETTKLLYLASSCSYPKFCLQPMSPETLMTGPLEPTNEAYATAKLAGMALVKSLRQEHRCSFISGIPANAFGPGDDYDPALAHVVGALIHRMHQAREFGHPEVVIWGTGNARREFVFADDLARACILAMETYDDDLPLNLGAGLDFSIAELGSLIREVVGYLGALRFDPSYPDGMPIKCLDSSRLQALGHRGVTPMKEALAATYRDYLAHHAAPNR
jgi:GDP-L-fucose synthase